MRSHGWIWTPWFECAQCGFDYPITYRVYQDGLPVCTYRPCYDKVQTDDGAVPTPPPLNEATSVYTP